MNSFPTLRLELHCRFKCSIFSDLLRSLYTNFFLKCNWCAPTKFVSQYHLKIIWVELKWWIIWVSSKYSPITTLLWDKHWPQSGDIFWPFKKTHKKRNLPHFFLELKCCLATRTQSWKCVQLWNMTLHLFCPGWLVPRWALMRETWALRHN